MLSYPVDEAETLLENKREAASQSLANCEEDMEFLREQITVRMLPRLVTVWSDNPLARQTMEVAIARVYNWDVVQKRKERALEEGSEGHGKKTDEPNG
jgi:hypothetical protein